MIGWTRYFGVGCK